MPTTVLVKEVVRDGVKLKVVARSSWDNEWELLIENPRGIQTHWYDIFDSGEAALNAGLCAIEDEGTAAFVDIEGFEYAFKRES